MSPSQTRSKLQSDLLPLFEFSTLVNSSLDLSFILNTLMLTVMGKMMVTKGVILLRREGDWFEVVVVKGIPGLALSHRMTVQKPVRTPIQLNVKRSTDSEWMKALKREGIQFVVPVIARRKVVGIVGLGERMHGAKYTATEQKLIASLVNLSGAAVEKAMFIEELKESNRNLDRKYQELNTLFELSKEFNVGLDAQRVVRLLTFSLLGQVGVNRYVICYEQGGKPSVVASRGDVSLDFSAIIEGLADLEGGTLLRDLEQKKKYAPVIKSLRESGLSVAIPLRIQHQTKGMIFLGEKLRGGSYERSDLEFLYALGSLACISIENARLFQEAIEKQKMEDELAIAREIQQGLLPRTLPSIPGFEVSAVNVTSKQVGGDYYDVVQRSETDYVIAIGDVSGKGMPASLLMANVQAAMRALTTMNLPLAEATARINDLTCGSTTQGRFITFFWGVLNTTSRQFCYVNAGHNPPIVLRANGTIERLEIGGMILGMLKTMTLYNEGTLTINPGDLLFLFTDGVSEAMNAQEVDFTEERLIEVLSGLRGKSPAEVISGVQAAVDAHTQGTPQSDDITMLALRAL
ncbi:MAG TPA: GAF domain-containing SpoIIE family protein phosphatase [Bacteroidota bacterium]|nr:GAF domain-containing SpoIIE family protein phosphatase [Bacteroidota bacterium]